MKNTRISGIFREICANLAIILLSSSTALAAVPARALRGFGNIPFGTPAKRALALNNGNGTMTRAEDGTSTLVYPILIAGMEFKVTQHFTSDNKASEAKLRYSSGEQPYPCIARFNYVLAHLNQHYGKPSAPPSFQREDIGADTHDRYVVAFGFADKSAILASAETIYPTPVAHKAGGAKAAAPAAAPAGASAPADQCRISLSYLPPRWAARF